MLATESLDKLNLKPAANVIDLNQSARNIQGGQADLENESENQLPEDQMRESSQTNIVEDEPAPKESDDLVAPSEPPPIKHSNYTHAIISSFVVSAVASVVMTVFFHHSPDGQNFGEVSEIVLENGILVSKTVSGFGYFFRLTDILTREITLLDRIRSAYSKSPLPKVEPDQAQDKYGIAIGFVVAVAAAVISLSSHNFFHGEIAEITLKACTTVIEAMSSYLGLGNRIGQAAKNLYPSLTLQKNR